MIRFFLFWVAVSTVCAQNYEVQVYGSETTPKGATMVELHSNFTLQGSKTEEDGVRPTNHAWHETVEITRGITPWFETAFYGLFSARSGEGFQWVGSHIRPRVMVPKEWNLPVGVGLSMEFGYQRPQYSADTWSLEIRPIVDKQIDRIYLAFNPTVDRSFHGPAVREGLVFSPNFKAAYDITKKVTGGIEYYGALGPITGFDPLREQQQQIIPTIDLNLGERWEFNFGVGVGMTHGTDHLIVKMIVGHRFGGRKGK
jgi:hypothetical protein